MKHNMIRVTFQTTDLTDMTSMEYNLDDHEEAWLACSVVHNLHTNGVYYVSITRFTTDTHQ